MRVYYPFNKLRIIEVDTNNHVFAIEEVRKHLGVPPNIPVLATIPGGKQ